MILRFLQKSLEAVISQTRPQLEAPQEIVVNQNDASTEHARLDEKQEVGEKLKDENAQQIKALKEVSRHILACFPTIGIMSTG